MVIWNVVSTVIITLLFLTPVIVAAPFSRSGRLPYRLGRLWARLFMTVNGIRIESIGAEKLEAGRSCVYISNHPSSLDPMAAALVIPNVLRFVGKRSLTKIPVFGQAARLSGMIFIDRADSAGSIEAINRAGESLREGISAFFFAEGTRSGGEGIRPFKKGGVILAINAGLPIVPVTIINSDRLHRRGSLRIRSGRILVVVGDPVMTLGLSAGDRDSVLMAVESVVRHNYRSHGRIGRKYCP
jgi:1-acyl-sn-glycerol-3-phosphate acyltransferase